MTQLTTTSTASTASSTLADDGLRADIPPLAPGAPHNDEQDDSDDDSADADDDFPLPFDEEDNVINEEEGAQETHDDSDVENDAHDDAGEEPGAPIHCAEDEDENQGAPGEESGAPEEEAGAPDGEPGAPPNDDAIAEEDGAPTEADAEIEQPSRYALRPRGQARTGHFNKQVMDQPHSDKSYYPPRHNFFSSASKTRSVCQSFLCAGTRGCVVDPATMGFTLFCWQNKALCELLFHCYSLGRPC